MAWIESHQKLEKSGKLIALCKALGINRCQAIGHLHCFWWWAVDNAEDGDISRFDAGVISEVSGWTDYIKEQEEMTRLMDVQVPEEDAFYKAMSVTGFIDVTGESVTIHNWEEYTGRYFEAMRRIKIQREKTRERVRDYRARNAPVTKSKALPKRNVTECNAHTLPNLTKPDKTKPKEKPKENTGESLRFAQIWNNYPRHEGKDKAFDHFRAQVKTDKDWLDIQNALENFKAKLKRDGTEEKYIPHGSTWFNKRWKEYVNYGGPDASNGGEGFFSPSALLRAKREAARLRGDAPPGPIPAGVGDLPDVPPEPEAGAR